MSTRNLLLLAEGPHDLELCARLLKPKGFSRIRSWTALKRDYPFWQRTVPEKWPQADDLLARHPVPLFLANPAGQSVAIVNATGISKLAKRLGFTWGNLDVQPDAVGVILDADDTASPKRRFDELLAEIRRLAKPAATILAWPKEPGTVSFGPPCTGVFVMPDNVNQGTLEDLLLDAAGSAYPQLLQAARGYVDEAGSLSELSREDLE
jgi:hypothetical protein